MRGWLGRWAWEDGLGGKGKKATKTHAARAFGKNDFKQSVHHPPAPKFQESMTPREKQIKET